MNGEQCSSNIRNLIGQCLPELAHSILIIFDNSTEIIALLFEAELNGLGKKVSLSKIKTARVHGTEPDAKTARQMLECDAIMCITKCSLAHTKARLDAESQGIPFLSMPAYDTALLSDVSMTADYRCIEPQVRRYADLMTRTDIIRIITDKGCDLTVDIRGRFGNCCPGLVNGEYSLGVRGKMILPSHGKEFFTSYGKHFFTYLGKQFFTLVGKDFFTRHGNQNFTSFILDSCM